MATLVDERRSVSSEAIRELIERLEMAFTPAPPKAQERWFSWMPLAPDAFCEGMFICREALGPGPLRFLDVGSGIGSKLCLANALGWRAEGIELHDGYALQSRRVFPFLPVTVADASEFDGYGVFDVVYCYRIATHWDEQERINRHISARMKPGALFFSASYQGPYPEWLEHVDGPVWRVPGA